MRSAQCDRRNRSCRPANPDRECSARPSWRAGYRSPDGPFKLPRRGHFFAARSAKKRSNLRSDSDEKGGEFSASSKEKKKALREGARRGKYPKPRTGLPTRTRSVGPLPIRSHMICLDFGPKMASRAIVGGAGGRNDP